MMPILALPGEINPGQLGPIKRHWLLLNAFLTSTISKTGIPSVIQMINGISLAISSSIASLANLAGT